MSNPRKLFWELVMVAAAGGFVYAAVEYATVDPWKALVMIPLMAVLGYLAVEVLYPLWFGER